MGSPRLNAFLRQHRRLALDSSVFIYQLEANPRYIGLTDPIFAWLEHSGHRAVTSTITMTELLVPAYRDFGERRVNEFYALLATFPNLAWIAPSLEIADTAASIRAVHRLHTPDALQAAAAINAQATGLVTNDAAFNRLTNFQTLVLDRCL